MFAHYQFSDNFQTNHAWLVENVLKTLESLKISKLIFVQSKRRLKSEEDEFLLGQENKRLRRRIREIKERPCYSDGELSPIQVRLI